MKPYTKKYHRCRYCKLNANRLYIRTRKLEVIRMNRHNKTKAKRGFDAIGWYCERCKMFETDEMIDRQDKENSKDSLGMKSDEEYQEFLRTASLNDIMCRILSQYSYGSRAATGISTKLEKVEEIEVEEIKTPTPKQ